MASKSTTIVFIFAIFFLLTCVSAKKVVGSVAVFVYDAESLPDKDPPAGTTGDLSDPYLKIWVDGNAPVKTKPDKDSLDYEVTDHFYFLRYAGQQKLYVQFWDSDADSDKKDDLLLSATIDLKTVCQTTIGDDINAPAFCTKFIEKETAPYYTVIIYKYGD